MTIDNTYLAALREERAQHLNVIDDVIETARMMNRSVFDGDERVRHDVAVARVDQIDAILARSGGGSGRDRWATVNVNTASSPAHASRSLDELLWATNETVPAGSVADNGVYTPSPHGAVAHVDRVVIRSEGERGIDAPRLSELQPEHRHAVRSFQEAVADMALFGLLVDKQAHSSSQGFEVARSHALFADRWRQVCRALDVDTSAEGGTWVPTGIGASVHEKVRAAGKVAPLFPVIPLPSNPWKFPIEGADATAYRVGEPTSDTATKVTASTPGTNGVTFDAEIFGGRVLFSRSVEADSAVAMLPFVTGKLIKAFVTAEERAILDGDTDGTHMDSDVGASTTDARTAWDGLRKKALAQTALDGAGAALSSTNLRTLRAMMGKWGINPDELAVIVGIDGYYDLLGDTNMLTVDKFGPQATILNGQLGSLYGAPVIVSEFMREDLNASGVHDAITTSEGYALLVNRSEWAVGTRMALDIEVDTSIYLETFQKCVVAFERLDFQHVGDDATNDDTAIIFEVSS